MSQDQLVELALSIAREAHEGQVDKSGHAYIEHPTRVAERLRRRHPEAGAGIIAAALLHDVLEDTELTRSDLIGRGIPSDVVDDVEAVTKRAGEPAAEYFARVRARAGARAVKHADIEDNTDPARLELLDDATRQRLIAKYTRSLQLLEGE